MIKCPSRPVVFALVSAVRFVSAQVGVDQRYGGAGFSMYMREALDFPTELSYRSVMVQNVFTDDRNFNPGMKAWYDAGKESPFSNMTDVTLEAWVKPVPTELQFNPDKGCCWPIFGINTNNDLALARVLLTFVDGKQYFNPV
ncbi:hypothetical protein HDU97_005703 [Phlyctochytrium planicorne]|nr:hypothetical protein HDU97_005703 [Phlyctochytrium planicorne]